MTDRPLLFWCKPLYAMSRVLDPRFQIFLVNGVPVIGLAAAPTVAAPTKPKAAIAPAKAKATEAAPVAATAVAAAGAGAGSTADAEDDGGAAGPSKRQLKLAAKGKLKPKKEKPVVVRATQARPCVVTSGATGNWAMAKLIVLRGDHVAAQRAARRRDVPCSCWYLQVAAPNPEKKKKKRVEAEEFVNTTPAGQKKGAAPHQTC